MSVNNEKLDTETLRAIEHLDNKIINSYAFYSHEKSELLERKLKDWEEKLKQIKNEILYIEDEF